MKFSKTQSGFTIWSLAFYLFLLGFAVFTTLKLFPIYMEDLNVSSVISSMESEPEDFVGAMSVHGSVMKRLGVNNVTRVTRDDVSVIRATDGRNYDIDIEYDVLVPYMGNISLLLNFKHTATVRGSGY